MASQCSGGNEDDNEDDNEDNDDEDEVDPKEGSETPRALEGQIFSTLFSIAA